MAPKIMLKQAQQHQFSMQMRRFDIHTYISTLNALNIKRVNIDLNIHSLYVLKTSDSSESTKTHTKFRTILL